MITDVSDGRAVMKEHPVCRLEPQIRSVGQAEQESADICDPALDFDHNTASRLAPASARRQGDEQAYREEEARPHGASG